MGHGGKRPGAGRPLGSKNKATPERESAIAETGVTPLDVMIEAMRAAYDAGDLIQASAHAKDAAPYVHPRLAQVEQTGAIEHRYVIEIPMLPETVEEWEKLTPPKQSLLSGAHKPGNGYS